MPLFAFSKFDYRLIKIDHDFKNKYTYSGRKVNKLLIRKVAV